MKTWIPPLLPVALALCALGTQGLAHADTGKLRLTGGVSTVDGAAGGGITPWALIGSNATDGEIGVSAAVSRVGTQDYSLNVIGIAVGIKNRVELSVAQQDFDTGATGVVLGLPGLRLKQSVVGVKVRVAGDAVLDSDSLMPQFAVGAQFKTTDAGALANTLTNTLGASTSGTDLYVSATKLFLAQGILVSGTLRATKANQGGLLGFGSSRNNNYQFMPELAVAYLLRKDLAIGFEYRAKPDNLNNILGSGVLKEDAWQDLFVAWSPTKNFSLTAAYVDLGQIAPTPFVGGVTRRQTGYYLSAQFAY
jgi:hypothetical protein